MGKPIRDPKYVDIYREKPIRVSVKVLVPVREHPKVVIILFNHCYLHYILKVKNVIIS